MGRAETPFFIQRCFTSFFTRAQGLLLLLFLLSPVLISAWKNVLTLIRVKEKRKSNWGEEEEEEEEGGRPGRKTIPSLYHHRRGLSLVLVKCNIMFSCCFCSHQMRIDVVKTKGW
jgi:hypothetical protein